MNQQHLIDELATFLGRRIRKATRPEFFQVIDDLFNRFEFVGLDQRVTTTDYESKGLLWRADSSGNVSTLILETDFPPGFGRIVANMHELEFLVIPEHKLTVGDAKAVSTLPHLKTLLFRPDPHNQDETIGHISRIQTLEALGIVEPGVRLDVTPLQGLPCLRTLVLPSEDFKNPSVLADFPALRNLAIRGVDGEVLQRLTQIERLYLFDTRKEADFSYLRRMPNLTVLIAEDSEIPTSILQELESLTSLATTFSHPRLDPLLPLKHLQSLRLARAGLSDLAALQDFPELRRLDLSSGETKDFRSLAGNPSLEFLDISTNPVSELPTDLTMPNLEHLVLKYGSGTRLQRADFLSNCMSLEVLDLSGQALPDLAPLGLLGNLRALNVSGNRLGDITPLSDLPNLSNLDISDNRIGKLSPLAEVDTLTRLGANGNPIEDHSSISGLSRMELLSLKQTGLADLAFLRRLRNLIWLDLGSNAIRALEPLLELPYLMSLDLSDNRIEQLPQELVNLPSLDSLLLSENAIEGLHAEHFSGSGPETLQSLRDYFRGMARGSVKHDQVKLLLVGNGRVGKTSVVSRLIDHQFDPDQPSTHGIQLRHWQLDNAAPERLDGKPLRVAVWDFGGQDIYHATHRLFMKTRALFLLVWDADTESARFSFDEFGERYENFRLPYWVDYVKALAHSPMIIVQNKVDRQADKDAAYGLELQQAYPPPGGILDYRHVSAKRATENGMTGLADAITLALGNLESIGQELPAQWVEVRDRLADMDHQYLDYDRYVDLCQSVGMQGTEHESLVRFLHQTGVIFYEPESFGQRLILDQKWAIEAVYALLDRRGAAYADLRIAGDRGLTLELLQRKVWRHFSVDEHQLLLEFMKSCEICFELTNGRFYVPQLLSEDKPSRVAVRWNEPTEFALRIDYPFLHRAIIERFIVRAGQLGADVEPEIWRDGIVVYEDRSRTEALVEAFPETARILVQARGKAPVDLIRMIRNEFEELHADFPATLTFCADRGRHFVDEQRLKEFAEAGATKVTSVDDELVELAPLQVFLGRDNRRLPQNRPRRPAAPPASAPSEDIFLSYAWGDPGDAGEDREAIVDRLCDTLVEKGYRVLRDKKNNGYRKLISDFMDRIGRGQLVVVVVSDKYLKSPYCMYELLSIYDNGGFRDRVFPIVLGDASIYNLKQRLQYVLHWQHEKTELEALIKEVSLDAVSAGGGAIEEYDRYYKWVFNKIDRLTSVLADWNALTPQLLEENSFERLLDAIDTRLAELRAA